MLIHVNTSRGGDRSVAAEKLQVHQVCSFSRVSSVPRSTDTSRSTCQGYGGGVFVSQAQPERRRSFTKPGPRKDVPSAGENQSGVAVPRRDSGRHPVRGTAPTPSLAQYGRFRVTKQPETRVWTVAAHRRYSGLRRRAGRKRNAVPETIGRVERA
ncbi:hypothetical protein AGIG_G5149 [Arapaima gigas]